MENISIQSYSAQLRVYSGSVGPPQGEPTTSQFTGSNPASKGDSISASLTSVSLKANDTVSRSSDGDSFSLSLEARIVQISMTRSDDGVNLDNSNSESKNATFGSGLVKTLMQTMSSLLGKDDAGNLSLERNSSSTSTENSESVNTIPNQTRSQRLGQSHGKHHRHDHSQMNPMGNPEDVASKVLQQLQQEHSQKGGSLQTFVDTIQKRMENRRTVTSNMSDGSSEFRTQVDTLITSGLTAWSQRGGQSLNIQA